MDKQGQDCKTSRWEPLTLQGGAMLHLSFGAILGATAGEKKMRLRYTIIGLILLLSSCMSTNKFIGMGGTKRNQRNLPVGVEVLIEMAEYCERIYDDGKEIRDNEFSYNVVQDRGVTIVSIRGTNNGRNVLTDLDQDPSKTKNSQQISIEDSEMRK